MPNPPDEFRQHLLDIQEVSPVLRESYRKELQAILHPPMTKPAGLIGSVLAAGLLVLVALIARADLYYHIRGLILVAHLALAASFVLAALYMLRDLRKRTQSHKSISSISGILTLASGILTVIVLITGLAHASEPKTMFGVFYVFVFYFACVMWSLDNRIKSAELAAREQSLRIECRLADLAERLQK